MYIFSSRRILGLLELGTSTSITGCTAYGDAVIVFHSENLHELDAFRDGTFSKHYML